MRKRDKAPIDTPHEAIEWAVQQGNTTKSVTGGLGLGLLLSFLRLNKGRIQIVSDKGYWEYDGKEDKKVGDSLPSAFPGTIVNLEFNLDDKSSYRLASERESYKNSNKIIVYLRHE